MTPRAVEMLEALYALSYKSDTLSENAEAKKLASVINSLAKVFDEILLADRTMLERMFLMNWCAEERYRIASEYIGISVNCMMRSPDREEVVRAAAEMVTSEVLADIFSSARSACSVSLKEFVLGWRILNESGEMRHILFNSNIQAEKLHPAVKEAYLLDKKNKDSEDRIEQLMREEFLSNYGGENNE